MRGRSPGQTENVVSSFVFPLKKKKNTSLGSEPTPVQLLFQAIDTKNERDRHFGNMRKNPLASDPDFHISWQLQTF